jgi:hypothetical protein
MKTKKILVTAVSAGLFSLVLLASGCNDGRDKNNNNNPGSTGTTYSTGSTNATDGTETTAGEMEDGTTDGKTTGNVKDTAGQRHR